jgi:phosphoribosyl 1,2-cyclic phosphodiesterase
MPKNATTLGFWGVRGSTPTVDRANWRYGGNTPCLELVAPDGSRFILDCGTGLRTLGNRRVAQGKPVQAHVFVTHYHWDHIQGIPFFAPLYDPQHTLHFHSFRSQHLGQHTLKRVLEVQMATPYFPVDVSAMKATRHYAEVAGGDTLTINGTRVTARWLNHPQGCLGFRFETSCGVIVYATDNEPGNPQFDKNLRELAAGADIFVNDAQYTPEQLAGPRRGWGHSSWKDGVDIAREVGAKHVVLFHHDPESTDAILDARLREARDAFPNVWAAAEGMVMSLDGQQARVNVVLRNSRAGQRRDTHFHATVSGELKNGATFEEQTIIHDLSFNGASMQLKHAPQIQSGLTVTIATPGDEHDVPDMRMGGHVVHCEPGPHGSHVVGVIFTDDIIEGPEVE